MIGGVPAAAADPSHPLSDTARRMVRALRNPTASGRAIAGRLARMPTAERRVRELANENLHLRELYEAWVPSGHFYSPFPDLDDYGRRAAGLRDPQRELPGIDLREDEQLALLEVLAALLDPASAGATTCTSTRTGAATGATGSTTPPTPTATAPCSTPCSATCGPAGSSRWARATRRR